MKGQRIDKHLAAIRQDLSRAKIQKLIQQRKILVNGKPVLKSSHVLGERDEIQIKEVVKKEFLAEKFNFEVVYEDKECLVINKPAGIVVHPGEGGSHLKGTVANALLSKVKTGVGGDLRPGIVHRLDKDTSGLLLVAKTKKAYEDLVEQFKSHKVKKSYLTLVFGKLEPKNGKIEAAIGRDPRSRKKMVILPDIHGKKATSEYTVKKYLELADLEVSLVEVRLVTGRTHQIRVHMAGVGFPVLGDNLYGNRKANRLMQEKCGLERQFLHAYKLKFKSPATGKMIDLEINLAPDLKRII